MRDIDAALRIPTFRMKKIVLHIDDDQRGATRH
jgi:hypothetical protein